jgi:LmbE family N-acetylglucosaminyl deacetylase
MQFHLPTAEIFVPDGLPVEAALARTTHLAIAAHQDDLEIMATQPILQCFQRDDQWFTGVVVSDGRGSPRDDLYKDYTDEAMRLVRIKEQKKAAVIGEYAVQIILDYPSRVIKDGANVQPVEDLVALLTACHPEALYTHNLADKHDTHVAVALRAIAALRRLPEADRPQRVYGCEVWRDLDWMVDEDKVVFDVSQICGGKRYDLASLGRRRAHATYYASHGTDVATGLTYGMDLTPLVNDPAKSPKAYLQEYFQRFTQDVIGRLDRLT